MTAASTSPTPSSDPQTTQEGQDQSAPVCVMSFNSSDPSGAGGIAGDVTTIAAMGAHGLPVVTSIVLRDTAEVFDHSALDADVVAFQEVDGPAAAVRVFPPDRYQLVLTDDDVVQRVGFAVRRGIAFERNPDLVALDVGAGERHRLRSGADITLVLPGGRLTVDAR